MNAFSRTASFLALMLLGAAFLPACGSKANVQSEKAPETVLNTETTPVVSTVSSENEGRSNVERSYTAKIHRAKGPNASTTISTTPANTPANTPVATQNTPPMETATAKKSGGSHWLLWLVVLLVLGGIGYYFWQKNQEESMGQSQPKPPTGGLSPVSGFTAVRSSIEETEGQKAPSIWTRKLF